jgi:hypothetical protein
MLLFDVSLATAALGIARMVFGVAVDLGPGPPLSLGSGGPWPPFVLATVLFMAAASLRPARRPAAPPEDRALAAGDLAPDVGALGPGPADLAPPVPKPTPVPRHRGER